MTKSDVWMPIYCGDYLKDTSDLSLAEHGAYFKLMMAYWQIGYVEDSAVKCYRICGALSDDERDAVDAVMRRFFSSETGILRNKRLDEELKRASDFRDKQRANGMLGGRPKKNPKDNPEETHGFSLANPELNPNGNPNITPSPSPSPSPSKPPSPSKSIGRKRQSSVRPDSWQPTEAHKELASQLGLSTDDQCQKFKDWHDAKGSVFADWDAAFRTWLRKSREFKPADRHSGFAQRDYHAGVGDDGSF